jgi:ATP-binding cassette subfamily B protein
VWFIGLIVFLYVVARSSTILVAKLAAETVATAASDQMRHLAQHSHSYFSNRFAGSISGKISSASDGLQQFLNQLMFDAYSRAVSIVGVVVVLGFVDWRFSAAFSVCILLVLILDIKMIQTRRPINKVYSQANVRYRGKSVDLLTNIAAVRQYAQSTKELTDLFSVLLDRKAKLMKQVFAAQQVVIANNVLVVILNMTVLALCYFLFIRESITIGQIVLVITLMANVNRNINGIGNILANLSRQYIDIQNGLEDIYTVHEITDKTNAEQLKVQAGTIAFSNLTFAYQSDTIFNNLNLNIAPGERIGLVGPSGAGKSTLVSLLLRQHDLTSGAILIDSQNIAQVTQDSLRSNIALVPQEPVLFHRTIAENIKYGKPDASYEEMVQAADRAQAREFIEALPEQYDTLVGERGVKLSGGQKQRVAIARAMLKEAPILVLDEATSALDSESEVAIQKALESLMENKTVIAVAHRLSTLRKMDRILVIDQGQIVEDGTHDTLTQSGGLYAKLWEHQAGGFID